MENFILMVREINLLWRKVWSMKVIQKDVFTKEDIASILDKPG